MLIEPEYFFVYGTLKSGYGNNTLLNNSEFIDFAVSFDTTYKMSSNGAFPMIKDIGVDKEDTYAIVGEIYQVNDLNTIINLDRLESNGFLYLREERQFVMLDTYEVVNAWVYLYLGEFPEYDEMFAKYFEFSNHEDDLTFAPYLWQNTSKKMCEWHK